VTTVYFATYRVERRSGSERASEVKTGNVSARPIHAYTYTHIHTCARVITAIARRASRVYVSRWQKVPEGNHRRRRRRRRAGRTTADNNTIISVLPYTNARACVPTRAVLQMAAPYASRSPSRKRIRFRDASATRTSSLYGLRLYEAVVTSNKTSNQHFFEKKFSSFYRRSKKYSKQKPMTQSFTSCSGKPAQKCENVKCGLLGWQRYEEISIVCWMVFAFKKRGNVNDDRSRSGRLFDGNVAEIREIIIEDRRQTVEQIVELSGVTWSSVRRILSEDLWMRWLAAKSVSKSRQLLTEKGYAVPFYSPNLDPCDFFFISSNEKKHKMKVFCRRCWSEEKKRRKRCQASQQTN